MFRGAKLTGVRNGGILLCPIHPDGETRRVMTAWLRGVSAASVEVPSGIPQRVFDFVWRVVDSTNSDINRVGCWKRPDRAAISDRANL
ncbi:hypothetical protein [Sphingomonas sp. CFBP 8760]|uniref:hypothetical protein n=1 Tax=Sphingomonas sp. CFBP 8760 TaxID=2775282 RepID=UPI001A91F1B4|nr:hypothetical protein [Sphingomonas sp. CFBP 8760]